MRRLLICLIIILLFCLNSVAATTYGVGGYSWENNVTLNEMIRSGNYGELLIHNATKDVDANTTFYFKGNEGSGFPVDLNGTITLDEGTPLWSNHSWLYPYSINISGEGLRDTGTSSFTHNGTFEFWVKRNSDFSSTNAVDEYIFGWERMAVYFEESDGKLKFSYYDGAWKSLSGTTTSWVKDEEYVVRITYENASISMYVDGVLEGFTTNYDGTMGIQVRAFSIGSVFGSISTKPADIRLDSIYYSSVVETDGTYPENGTAIYSIEDAMSGNQSYRFMMNGTFGDAIKTVDIQMRHSTDNVSWSSYYTIQTNISSATWYEISANQTQYWQIKSISNTSNNLLTPIVETLIYENEVGAGSVDITFRNLDYDNLTANVLIDIANKIGTLTYINISHVGNDSSEYCLVHPNGTAVQACITATSEGETIWFNGSADRLPEAVNYSINESGTQPPASITELTNTTGNFYHNWTWTNPVDADFNYTTIYINDSWVVNTSNEYYNLSADAHNQSTISTKTVDTAENINTTWVNHTSIIPNNAITISDVSVTYTLNEGETLSIDANYTDADGDIGVFADNSSEWNVGSGTGIVSWVTVDGDDGVYSQYINVTDSNGSTDTHAFTVTVNNSIFPPTVTLLSMTPSTICQNCTGNISIIYGISHSSAGLNNTSISFIYRDYDHNLSDSNHSIRPPINDLASEWNFDGRILRGANRNESLNFENNATITGGDIYSWSGLDENNSEMSIVPVNDSYTKVYINSTIHRVMPQMHYIDRSEVQEAAKTTINIYKNHNVLVKFWNFEIFKGNYDFLGVGYTDTTLNSNSALWPSDANPVSVYYVSSGYDPTTGGDPLISGFAVYMLSLNASEWMNHVHSPHANSSYVRGFINNTLLHSYINTTNISYLLYVSNTPQSKSFQINVTDVASSSNVSFANTTVLWSGDTTYNVELYTPNIWFAFMKDNISFDHKLWCADNNDRWGNSTISSTTIGEALFPPTKPSFYAFHNEFQDFDMNGTYHDTIQIQVSAGSDPDGGVVTHNITLHYGNQTLIAIINGSAVAENGIYTNISFDTTPYYSQTENYTLKVVATDDEGETATTWLGVNFTLYVTPNATNLANTTGNFYVNYTWSAGSGATTDSYNVSINSTWYNGSSQAWANNSTVAHGSIEIIVYAYNESSGLSAGYLTDNVTVSNNVPVLSGIPNLNTNEDNDLLDIIDLDDHYSDADSDTPSFSVESNNQSAHMTIDISGTNTVDFIPDADWYGTAEIVFKVEDGYGGSDTDTMIFTVNPVNDAPILDSIGAQNVNENETLYINADATDVEGDPLTFSCSRTDLFTDFSTSTGRGNWTPGFADAGTYYVDFGVSDGSLTDNETVTITVTDVPTLAITSYTPINNRPPDIPDDDRTFTVVFNQVCNITWYYNGILQQTNTSVDNASWTSTAVEGMWNVTVIGDTNGTASHTWTWIVAPPVYVPISIFAGLCGVMLMSLGGAIYLTGPVGIVTSLLGMVLAFLNSKIVINGTLIQNIGGIDNAGNVVQGVTVIQIPALSYLFTFIGIIMLGLTVYLVYREIKYKKTSGYQEVEF